MSGDYLDDPNRNAVGLEPAWAEGYGGGDTSGGGGPPSADDPSDNPLDDMTKDELIDEAAVRGVSVSGTMTKAEIREALEAD